MKKKIVSKTAEKSKLAMEFIEARASHGVPTPLSTLHALFAYRGIATKPTDNHFIWNLRRKGLVELVGPGLYRPARPATKGDGAPDIERVITLAATIKFKMDALQRRVQGKPGHQNITPMELIANARKDLDEIERELNPKK